MSYIGKVDIKTNSSTVRYSIGSTLYGKCDTLADVAAKMVSLDDFTNLIRGVTVYIKFSNGNTVTSNVTLMVGLTEALPVVGNCTCKADEILAFTYEEDSQPLPSNFWHVHSCGNMVSQNELASAINSIPRGVAFKGAVANLPDQTTSYNNYNNGDIIIVGSKEYIYQRGSDALDSSWNEIGDESAYALESNTTTITTVNVWSDATVTDGVLTIPTLTTNTAHVITPRT